MLHTDEKWEDIHGVAILRLLLKQPRLKRFRCMEVPLNVFLFHVDLLLVGGGANEKAWHRFIVDEVSDVLSLVADNETEKVRISMQSRRDDELTYEIHSVIQIIEVNLFLDQVAYHCVCKNGQRFYNTYREVKEEDVLSAESVWTAN